MVLVYYRSPFCTCQTLQFFFTCNIIIVVHFLIFLLHRARGVQIHGIKYMCNSVIRVSTPGPMHCSTLPFLYCLIQEVLVHNNIKVFVVIKLNNISFEAHLRAFKVSQTSQRLLVTIKDLFCQGVLHLKQRGVHTYVVERDHWGSHLNRQN